MRSTFLSAGAILAILMTGTSAEAQRTSSIMINRGAFSFEPFGGYLISQNFIDGPLDTRLGSVSAPLFGVQASLPLAPGASIIGSIGYSTGDLEVGAPI